MALQNKPAGFSLERFKRNRRTARLAGIALFWGGVAMFALDMTTPFPTPLRGQYTAWWVLVILAGAGLWMSSKKLPAEEAVEVARYCRGELKVTDLAGELHVTLDTAELTLRALARKGYARCEQRDEICVFVFPEIRDNVARAESQLRDRNR